MFIFSFVFYSFEPLLSYYSTASYGATPSIIAIIFIYLAIFEVVFQTFLGNYIVGKVGEYKLITIGILTLGIGLFLTSMMPSIYGYMITLPIIGFSVLVFGSANSLLSKRDPENVGSLIGVNQFFASLGGILGPIIILSLYEADSSYAFLFILLVTIITAGYLIFSKKLDIT